MTTVSQIPDRSVQQRMTALQNANSIRLKRAQLKRDVKAGTISAALVVMEPPVWSEGMRVIDLLSAIPKWGAHKVDKALYRTQVGQAKRLGGLTERQRRALADAIDPPPVVKLAPQWPSPVQDRALAMLRRVGGEGTAATLAQRCGLEAAQVWQALRRLERRGLVERSAWGTYRLVESDRVAA